MSKATSSGRMPAKHPNKGPAPIEKLDEGTLWYMFSMNTHRNPPEYPSLAYSAQPASLTTTRLTSQVCKRWRDLLLSSPSVWGSALDLQSLDQRKNDWRNEVLRRTGNSVLTIHGDVCSGRPSTEFFLSILNDHWTRVRGLCVHVDTGNMDDKRWLCLRNPAPNLEFFHVHLQINPTTDAFNPSEQTPHLISFVVSYIPLNPDVSFLPHLRKLKVIRGASYTVPCFLRILQCMPSLESLEIQHVLVDSSVQTSSVLPHVTPSRLVELKVTEDFPVAIALLAHITPPSRCNLFLDILQDQQLTSRDFSLFSRLFSAFFTACRPPPQDELTWSVDHTGSLRLINAIPRGENFFKNSFFMSIEGDPPDLQGIPYAIAQVLSSCDLRSITKLDLDLEPGTLDTSNASLAAFLSGLTSVESLYTYVSTLHILGDLLNRTNALLLPSLIVLFLKEDDEDWDTAAIMRFLLQRRDKGAPITTLELPASHQRQSRFLFLKGINGLKVKWIEESDVDSDEDSDEDSDDSMISVSD